MLADAPPAQICIVEHEAPSIEAARAARLRGDYNRASRLLTCVLIDSPQSADAWVELGFVDLASGQGEEARAAFLRALETAPDYDDAKFGLALIDYRAGDPNGARVWLQRMSAERANDPDVLSLHRAVAATAETPRATWRWDAFAAYSSLSNDLAPWREASIAMTRRSGRSSVGLVLERVQRFGLADTFGEIRFSRQFSAGTWGVAAGAARGARFRPAAVARFEYATREGRDTMFDAALTIARYRVGQIDQLALHARRQVAAPLQLSATGILVRDEMRELRSGYGVGAAWSAYGGIVVDASWTDAPESSEGMTIDVRSTSVGLAADIRPNLRVRFGVTREEREAFDRSEFALSITRTF
jgi:YaiO family outer membrane protein